ncbi:MAG: hypothetical protein M1368_06730 [Thaumarchaeota archaeon]|nr:hypothetical protein [Nitrososphaerota archaeon]
MEPMELPSYIFAEVQKAEYEGKPIICEKCGNIAAWDFNPLRIGKDNRSREKLCLACEYHVQFSTWGEWNDILMLISGLEKSLRRKPTKEEVDDLIEDAREDA